MSAVLVAWILSSANLIQNPDFESGTSPWQFYTNGTGTFSNDAAGPTSARAGHIQITAAGTNVQLYQAAISLDANAIYRLSFKAFSNSGHDMSVSIFKHAAPYTNYGLAEHVVNLGTSWAAHAVEFMASGFTGTITDARLMFMLAPHAITNDEYFFDDVELVTVDLCSDGQQNQNEAGVDCGGPCSPCADTIAPSTTAVTGTDPTANSVTLVWTAPGDDGDMGSASSYDIRYSTAMIVDAAWESATQVADEPAPKSAGTEQSLVVSGLDPGTTYYFAIKAIDEAGNSSALSNVPSVSTCAIETTGCGSDCVSLRDDPDHCGACDNACAEGEVCMQGVCAADCVAGAPVNDRRCVTGVIKGCAGVTGGAFTALWVTAVALLCLTRARHCSRSRRGKLG